MDNKEFLATKLGFDSINEMEAYHELCKGYFKEDTIMTKALCEKHIKNNELEKFIHIAKEDRLEGKIYFDFTELVESVKLGNNEKAQYLKSLIDYELSELDKYFAMDNENKVL